MQIVGRYFSLKAVFFNFDTVPLWPVNRPSSPIHGNTNKRKPASHSASIQIAPFTEFMCFIARIMVRCNGQRFSCIFLFWYQVFARLWTRTVVNTGSLHRWNRTISHKSSYTRMCPSKKKQENLCKDYNKTYLDNDRKYGCAHKK